MLNAVGLCIFHFKRQTTMGILQMLRAFYKLMLRAFYKQMLRAFYKKALKLKTHSL